MTHSKGFVTAMIHAFFVCFCLIYSEFQEMIRLFLILWEWKVHYNSLFGHHSVSEMGLYFPNYHHHMITPVVGETQYRTVG